MAEEIEEMLIIKGRSDEKDMNPQMPAIQKYIEDEIVRYERISRNMADDRKSEWEALEGAFLKAICGN